MRYIKRCIWLLASVTTLNINAAPPPAHDGSSEAAQHLQQRLQAMKTYSASFQQKILGKKRVLSQSSGTMALQRPGKFVWNTLSPMKQRVVADGRQIWIYDVELEQVTVKGQQKGMGGTAGLFLSGAATDVLGDFSVREKSQGSQVKYDLQAHSGKDNFQRVQLQFDGNNLSAIELYDQLGQHTIVHLSQVKMNPVLSAKLFTFKPPKGVDVVRQ